MSNIVVVLGDVHSRISLAAEGLERIEAEIGRRVDQVFSVGDLGLFLGEEDWDFLTGPKKHRRPEDSPGIRRAWQEWRWPLSVIGGNHEPWNRYRDWDPGYFGGKLEYAHAGELSHGLEGLRVAGLSGIHHPEETDFLSGAERRDRSFPRAASWPDMVRLVSGNQISLRRLAYYKEHELRRLESLAPSPHLLLLHDWPVPPPHIEGSERDRPEARIVEALRPAFVCCGHHHRFSSFPYSGAQVFALNILADPSQGSGHGINPGWAVVFEWNDSGLRLLQTWPQGGF